MDYNVQVVGSGEQVKQLLTGVISSLQGVTGDFKLDLTLHEVNKEM